MKKIFYLSLILVFFTNYSTVLAQTAFPSSVILASPSTIPSPAFVKSLSAYISQLKVLLTRSDNISQRLMTRLIKMKTANKSTSGSNNLVNFEAQQKTFAVQLEQLKINLPQLDLASQTLSVSSSPKKDFPLFKTQALTFIKDLKNVYKLELELVTELKAYSQEASPAVQLVR